MMRMALCAVSMVALAGYPLSAALVVPYDASTKETTPVEMSATDVESAQWPLEVTLSEPIAIPASSTLLAGSIALLKVPKAAKEVTSDDFLFTTGSATLLPRGVIAVADDAEDPTLQVVSFAYRPVAVYVANSTVKSLNGQYSETSGDYVWSNHLAPTPDDGYDYYFGKGGTYQTASSNKDAITFNGASLTVSQSRITLKHKTTTFNDLVMLPRSSIRGNGYSDHTIAGAMCILGNNEGPVTMIAGTSYGYNLNASLSGDGVIVLTKTVQTPSCSITGNNSSFTGTIVFTNETGGVDSEGFKISVSDATALGGTPSTFNPKALAIKAAAKLSPNKTMTLNTQNRGIYVEAGGFDVAEGRELTILEPLRVNGTLIKHNAGTLVLGGAVSFGADGTSGGTGSDNIFKVKAGNVEALSDAAVKGFAFNFSAGAGILLKPGIGLQYGLAGTFTAVENIPVALDLPDGLPDMKTFSVPICTVTSGAAPTFDVSPVDGVTLTVVSEPVVLDGVSVTRYSLSCYNPNAPLVVPYDAATGTTEPVVFTGDAATTFVADSTWPLNVKLSEDIPMSTAGGTLELLKLPKAAKTIVADDFVFDVGSDSLLPRTTLSVADDPNDSSVQVLSVTIDPVIVFVSQTQVRGMNAQKSDDGNSFTWSDEATPHHDSDYYFGAGVSWYSNDGYHPGTATFNGKSLTIDNSTLTLKHRYLSLADLSFLPGGRINCGGYKEGECYHEINGAIRISGTDAKPAEISAGGNQYLFHVNAALSGDGVLKLSKESNRQMTGRLTGDNSAFTGRLVFTSNLGGTDGTGLTIQIPAPSALGGVPAEFDPRSLTLQGPSTLAPTNSMTLETENRGIYVTAGGFSVAEGLVLTVKEPLRVNGTLLKHGAGTLALAGAASFGSDGESAGTGGNNVFKVKEGTVEALSDAAVKGFAFNFSEGAGILLKPGAGLEYGMTGSFTSDAAIPVSLDLADGFPPDAPAAIPVCTVTSGEMPAFNVLPNRDFKVTLVYDSVTLDGVVVQRCLARCQQVGLTVVIR